MPAISECPGTQVRKINQRGAPVIPVKAGIQMFFDFSGFWVGLAIARLPGMAPKLFNGFREHSKSFCIIPASPLLL